MGEDDPIKTAQEGVSIVKEIIKVAGDDPKVKEAAGNLGQTAVTLARTINNALLPLAAVNFAFEKAKIYFSEKFQQDITEKAEKIPPEHIIQPKASVAGPALQGLAFTHEEPDLKEMFLNLLATSMDERKAALAHPAFVEIIKQLDSDDARLVRGGLESEASSSIVELSLMTKNGGYKVLLRHLLNLRDMDSQEFIENPQLSAHVDNWIRLGLVVVDYTQFITGKESYSWVNERPEFLRFRNALEDDTHTLNYERGIIYRTELGKQFAYAIGLLEQ